MAGGALVGNVRRKSNMTNSLLCLLKSLCTEEVAVKTLRLSQAHVNGTIKHPAYKLCWCCGAPWVPGAVSLPSVTSIKDNGIVTLSDQVERTLLYRSLSQHFQILRNDSQKIDKTYFRGLGNTVGLTYLSRTFCNDLHSENSFASPKKRLHSFALPHRTTPQVGCTRSYSRKHRNNHEETKMQVRGGAVYLPNPLTWLSAMWNKAKLRYKFDPSFSEREFLQGAKQAISYVMSQVCRGKFDLLNDIVTQEAIALFRVHLYSLSETEKAALTLMPGDMVLLKIRDVHLHSEKGAVLAFVDIFCVGLKMVEDTPYLVNLDIRFKRDYSTEPPRDWVVAGLSRMHVDNLED
ncbi:uncharacterized protein LOC112573604 [Pomacea canaliculata]|uniref:uncharacterized protein LOC112573604 n=1 Tax=Pomacea canaliculata TaxID=400727 RepID=UPI000D73FA50|nr:uncharacterized protein LOC112573604 [Pomacea canaliculata]